MDRFKCNCSICTNASAGFVLVKPARIQLLTGTGAQTEYLWTPRGIHGQTCTISFARSAAFAPPDAASTGRQEDLFYFMPVASLDNADPDELAAAAVRYIDGGKDYYDRRPKDENFDARLT
jgi:hypothetical protein